MTSEYGFHAIAELAPNKAHFLFYTYDIVREKFLLFSLLCRMKKYKRNYKLLVVVACRLKELRTAAGKSQADVYIDTDINIVRVESGRTNITLTTLMVLCDYYGISLEEFFKGIP